MSIVLQGSTSGSVTLQEPAIAGSTVLTLPAVSGTVLTTTSPKAGNVIQVVSATYSTSTSTTGSTYVASTITASITPTSSSSKIFILANFYARTSAAGVSVATTIYRGATDLGTSTYDFSYIYGSNTALELTTSVSFLDSPATTSSTTYTLYFRRADNAGTAYLGNTANDNVITLMEIAA